MPQALSKDATLRSLRSTLTNPEAFVRKVLGVMLEQKRGHGDLVVRLGITGTGHAPNYRFEDVSGAPLVAIDGANHEPWPDGAEFRSPGNWSSAVMTENDVKDLIGDIRPYNPKPRP